MYESLSGVSQSCTSADTARTGAAIRCCSRSCMRVGEARNCSKGSGSAAALASPCPSPRRAPEPPDVAVILGKGSGCLCAAEPKRGRWDGAVPGALRAGFVPEQERAAPCRFASAGACACHWCVSVPQGAAVWLCGPGEHGTRCPTACSFLWESAELMWSRGVPDCNKALMLLLPCKGERS